MTLQDREAAQAERHVPPPLTAGRLHVSLSDDALEAMNFLNEIAGRFPQAISLAAGRPTEALFNLDEVPRHLAAYIQHALRGGESREAVQRQLLQYGRTKGIIHQLIARHLAVDENIHVDPASIVVTVGCQEAMVLALRALCATSDDIVVAGAPCYVGLTGAAALLGIEVRHVRETARGLDLAELESVVQAARAEGKRPRACYVTPDFANPSGASMDLDGRCALLELARRHDFHLLEDNPYGLFQADDERRLPTLKALDQCHRVVYLGSLAKTCLPGLRIGYAVADQPVMDARGRAGLLADELSKLKSMLTVNTSPLAQAIAGGMLLEHDCSLLRANRRQIEIYRQNLRAMLDGLERRFGGVATPDLRWNVPCGGFFVVVTVPFDANDEALLCAAERFGVLWTPMRHFYAGAGGERQLRLSVSAVTPEQIELGLDRFAAFVTHRRERASSALPAAVARGRK